MSLSCELLWVAVIYHRFLCIQPSCFTQLSLFVRHLSSNPTSGQCLLTRNYWLIILISYTASKWGKYLFSIIGGFCIFRSLIGLDWIILKVLQKLHCGICSLMLLTESGDYRLNWRNPDWHFWGMVLSALSGYFMIKKWEARIFPLAFFGRIF